jgi:FtsH-binding integral membrane protein
MPNRVFSTQKIIGLGFIVFGLLMFYILLPILASQGLQLVSIPIILLLMVIPTGIGCFLIVHPEKKPFIKSLLVAICIGVPWSLIFFINLPDELQLPLAGFVALIVVLSLRYYVSRKSQKQEELT